MSQILNPESRPVWVQALKVSNKASVLHATQCHVATGALWGSDLNRNTMFSAHVRTSLENIWFHSTFINTECWKPVIPQLPFFPQRARWHTGSALRYWHTVQLHNWLCSAITLQTFLKVCYFYNYFAYVWLIFTVQACQQFTAARDGN